jgi:peptide/nickel transport system permease protein
MTISDKPLTLADRAYSAPVALRPRWMNKGLLISGGVLVALILMAVFASVLAPYDPYQQNLGNRLAPPFWHEGSNPHNILGTDVLGRDLLSRLIYGARVSIFIGVVVASVSACIGICLGLLAGYYGGWLDRMVSFLITARLATPVILVALAVVGVFGASLSLVVTVLGLLLWDRFALVTRSTTQQVRSADYITAAKAQGMPSWKIILQEVFPNISNSLIVVFTLEVAHAIILEAALSFLELGVPSPLPSWGLMVAEGKAEIFFDPWLIGIPGALLFMLVFAINVFGDGLRDVLAAKGGPK